MNRCRDWLEQSKRDMQRAQLDIKYEFWEWACFTSQQAAEKAVKALLMNRGIAVWGHAITPRLGRLEDKPVPEQVVSNAQLLDAYYISTPYPYGFPEGKPADYFNSHASGPKAFPSSPPLPSHKLICVEFRSCRRAPGH